MAAKAPLEQMTSSTTATSAAMNVKCFFCGYNRHPRSKCPAKDAMCNSCANKGHFSQVCKSSSSKPTSAALPTLAIISAASPSCLSEAIVKVQINRLSADALIDTGSSESFVSNKMVKAHKLELSSADGEVFIASTSLHANVRGYCIVELVVLECTHSDFRLSVLQDLSRLMPSWTMTL